MRIRGRRSAAARKAPKECCHRNASPVFGDDRNGPVPHLAPQHWKILEKIFLKDGFTFYRQDGSHRVYVKGGLARPVIIPAHHTVDVEVIKSNMRTAGMVRDRYFKLLKEAS